MMDMTWSELCQRQKVRATFFGDLEIGSWLECVVKTIHLHPLDFPRLASSLANVLSCLGPVTSSFESPKS
jgi:hypothetical protein